MHILILIFAFFVAIPIIISNSNKQTERREEAKRKFRENQGKDYTHYSKTSTNVDGIKKTVTPIKLVKKEYIKYPANEPQQEEIDTIIPEARVLKRTISDDELAKSITNEANDIVKQYDQEYVHPNNPSPSQSQVERLIINGFKLKSTSLLPDYREQATLLENITKKNIHSSREMYVKYFKIDNYNGDVKISPNDEVISISVELINFSSTEFKSFYFNAQDSVKISLLLDYKANIVDFLVYKTKTDYTSFKEIGNYLYNYPNMTINKFGKSQFSYLQATKLCNMLISFMHKELGIDFLLAK